MQNGATSCTINTQLVFPRLHDERGGPPHWFSKQPRSKYADIAISEVFPVSQPADYLQAVLQAL